jgi:preprotein translocase subunit SecG
MDIVRIIEIIWCVSAFGLMAMVLLHSPKGDGIGGIGGQAQLFSSTKSAESNLNRITWGLFLVFMTLTIVLSANLLSPVTTAPLAAPPVLGN